MRGRIKKLSTAVEKTITQPITATENKTQNTKAVAKLKLLIVVINKSKAEFYLDFLQGFGINLKMVMMAKGTARTEMMEYLGLGDNDKVVLMNVVHADKADEVLVAIEEKFHTVRNGKGIAFTIPLSGTIGVASYQFLSNNRMMMKEEG